MIPELKPNVAKQHLAIMLQTWNKLPRELRSALRSVQSFRSRLKTHFFLVPLDNLFSLPDFFSVKYFEVYEMRYGNKTALPSAQTIRCFLEPYKHTDRSIMGIFFMKDILDVCRYFNVSIGIVSLHQEKGLGRSLLFILCTWDLCLW